MTYTFPLPKQWRKQGWKVKIWGRETAEEPHATIVYGRKRWRLGLRTCAFLDAKPDPRDVPGELIDCITAGIATLREHWDEKYPKNRVFSQESQDER